MQDPFGTIHFHIVQHRRKKQEEATLIIKLREQEEWANRILSARQSR